MHGFEKHKRYQITIDETNEQFFCRKDQNLLVAMTSTGKRGIRSGCHGGGCGICKIHILEGHAHTQTMSRTHISEEDERNGIVLACRVHPASDIKLRVIGKFSKNILGRDAGKKYGFV